MFPNSKNISTLRQLPFGQVYFVRKTLQDCMIFECFICWGNNSLEIVFATAQHGKCVSLRAGGDAGLVTVCEICTVRCFLNLGALEETHFWDVDKTVAFSKWSLRYVSTKNFTVLSYFIACSMRSQSNIWNIRFEHLN